MHVGPYDASRTHTHRVGANTSVSGFVLGVRTPGISLQSVFLLLSEYAYDDCKRFILAFFSPWLCMGLLGQLLLFSVKH